MSPNPIVVGRVCPERAASILHPQPGALGTDAPYLEVHGEGESEAARSKIVCSIAKAALQMILPLPEGEGRVRGKEGLICSVAQIISCSPRVSWTELFGTAIERERS